MKKVAAVGLLALLGFACWLASEFGAAREGLISLFALVVLVGGGNLLSGRGGPGSRRGAPSARETAAAEPVDGVAHGGDEPAS